jgi:hypothetical protein
MAQQPLVGQGLLSFEASRSHSDTPHSAGLLWTSDQPDAETLPDNTQHSQGTEIHAAGGIRTRNRRKLTAADPRLRPRGHWDGHTMLYYTILHCTTLHYTTLQSCAAVTMLSL